MKTQYLMLLKMITNVWGCFWNEWQISWTGTPTYTLNNSTNTTGSQFADDPNLVIKGKLELEVEMAHRTDCLLMEHLLLITGQRVVSKPYIPYH